MKIFFGHTLRFILLMIIVNDLSAQGPVESKRLNGKLLTTLENLTDTLVVQFQKQKLNWPPKSVFLRSFKYEKQLELWIRNNEDEPFRLFKIYPVCMQSGTLGPKRMEGDYQVPEGFYHINDFNSNSYFHLSLGLNYPNASDHILSDSLNPGSLIYIHGNCVSTGCISIKDLPIEEVFFIASKAREQGQEFIPVHIFPVRYNNKRALQYLSRIQSMSPALTGFHKGLRPAFEYFEQKKKPPLILVNEKGDYLFH
jgi:murein L,D-transpeptidase YafK